MVKSKFSVSVHIMTFLAYYNEANWHTSTDIAESIKINPALVRLELTTLKKAGLIESKEGKSGGVRLAKSARKISLADIFMTVKGDSNVLSFSKNEPDMKCKIGHQINNKLKSIFDDIDNSIVKELQQQSLEEFKNQF